MITKIGVAVAALLLAAGQAAVAGVVTETYSDPSGGTFTATPFGVNPAGNGIGTNAGTLDGTHAIGFQGFTALCAADPTCAATSTGLTGVQFTLTENAQASGSGTEVGTGPITVLIYNIGSFALEGSVAGTVLSGGSSTVLLAADNTSSAAIDGGASITGAFTTGTLNFTSGAINSDLLTTGLSNFLTGYSGWDGDSGSSSILCGSGNCTGISTTDAGNITVTAIYDYSTPQVPEPCGVAVLASGLLGLGFFRYRRSL